MLEKIVELRGIPLENGYEIIYGADFDKEDKVDFGFSKLFLGTGYLKPIHETYVYGHMLIKEKDLFKDFLLNNTENLIGSDEIEEQLLVIIPYSTIIETTGKKIAGRYPTEAILEMRSGDIVKVSKCSNIEAETYMVVQGGNELFLVKKNR